MPDIASRVYQTHEPGQPGMSDSAKKLQRLKIPKDLSGKAVLDIGCNEGFFCRIAKERGAGRVVGIDFDRARLNEAIKRYAPLGVDFRFQSWETLPEGKFDLIFWTSAMHYERDPKKVVKNIRAALNDGGLFILECGVLQGEVPEMRYIVRHSDVCAYPSRPYLVNEILAGFAVREVSHPEITEGDPVPRAVFHSRLAKPEIVIVRGVTGTGKSSFVQRHFRDAAKIIRLDYFISDFCRAPFAHNDFLKFVQSHYDPNDLGKVYSAIDRHSMTEKYIELLCGLLSVSDRITIIEGFLTDKQFDELQRCAGNLFRVWEMTPQVKQISSATGPKPAAVDGAKS